MKQRIWPAWPKWPKWPMWIDGCVRVVVGCVLACATASCTLQPLNALLRRDLPERLGQLADRPLGPSETAVLERSGFVISEIDATSFHGGYAALFKAHEPVYFTADAILHALHVSFDTILKEIELNGLIPDLNTWIDETRAGLAKSDAPAPLRADLDLYLSVARSLLDDKAAAPAAGADAGRVGSLLAQGQAASGMAELELFGLSRLQDFSQFKPRGHYADDPRLQRYFRAMMWLGTVELRLAEKDRENPGRWKVNRSVLDGAALLAALQSEAAGAAWRRIDHTTHVFVGPPDSMSFPGLNQALAALGYPGRRLADIGDDEIVRALAPAAEQKIRSGLKGEGEAPVSFLTLGQRFVVDSQVFSRVTYASIPRKRMMPSPLDVGAAVFRNPAAGALLESEIQRYDYRGALEAAGADTARMLPELGAGNLYHGWLQALAELSPEDGRDAKLPSLFRTEAWQRRMLGSQLASWAELRHDTLLYAKQSYTTMALCEYPDGYVDPYPGFFVAIARMAELGRRAVEGLQMEAGMKRRMMDYFGKLGEVAARLRGMAEREQANLELEPEQVAYLNKAVSLHSRNGGCTTIWEPEGWYADIYYQRSEALSHKPVIADVHTQPTDEIGNIVGKVLHVGTSRPRLITVRIETCSGPRTYRGLVSSYHEVVTEQFERLTDGEWFEKLSGKEPPADPEWLRDFVVR